MPYDYSLEEWNSHTKTLLASIEGGFSAEALLHWFYRWYADAAEAVWKANRFLAGTDWMLYLLDSYSQDFEGLFARSACPDEVSSHMVATFWRLYAAIPEAELTDFVPTAELVRHMVSQSLKASVAG